ncbi:MAG: DUF3604 domain-containing protein [Gammaproteobacteria bacterium]|nr:DUF3604 domain-containing protein [Gammaproteobacteria bacterium]
MSAAPPARAEADSIRCDNAVPGEKQLLWGDLHVHTAWSLDAYAFGAIATPADAYAFARGQELRLGNGEMTRIDRPLDFAAVTDHAETFDVMFLCTDPSYSDHAYCRAIRDGHREHEGRRIFTDYLLPIVAQSPGRKPEICSGAEGHCLQGNKGQWRRVQEVANQHDDPCRFTALIGYEWSASPGGRHWHRNVIFRSAEVPDQAFDYRRYPKVAQLWTALDQSCRLEDGCDVLAIPHNINWSDGGGFDVAEETPEQLALRARYERLAEIHQEKGNSECLPATPGDDNADCSFERLTGNFAQDHVSGAGGEDPDDRWQRMRSTYYRSLLTRGLLEFEASDRALNPLMLGAIGSTDNHLGTPGRVQEDGYWGSMSMLWQDDAARLGNTGYNPGGLVAVWAEQNTRGAVFDALKRREAYATSGPRISLRFGVVASDATTATACNASEVDFKVAMGGVLVDSPEPPRMLVLAGKDDTPLARVEIVEVDVQGRGGPGSRYTLVADFDDGTGSACRVWEDPEFAPAAPSYWYARVIEQPTPRWSKLLCERLDRCTDYPDADRMTEERAWSSPIWYEPTSTR